MKPLTITQLLAFGTVMGVASLGIFKSARIARAAV